jgi:hypothetical protein
MSRPILFILSVFVLALTSWFFYRELRQARALTLQPNEVVTLFKITPPATTKAPLQPKKDLIENTATANPAPRDNSSTGINREVASAPEVVAVQNGAPAIHSTAQTGTMPSTLVASETPTPSEMTPQCSSFDKAGLLAAFNGALATFIADAAASYGDQYQNLQYQLSSTSGTLEGEQGTVTTSYSGTVQEISTGETVSASGTIRATFSWDGCAWQVVDYSF